MPGTAWGEAAGAAGEARGTQRFAGAARAGEQGSPPPRISFTSRPACGIAVGAPAWVQLGAGHPKKGTLAPQPPRQPRESAPRRLRGPGLRGG